MKLRDYLIENNITHEEFAKSIGYTRCHFTSILNGIKNPTLKFAKRVQRKTKKEFMIKDLLNGSALGKDSVRKIARKPTTKKKDLSKNVFSFL